MPRDSLFNAVHSLITRGPRLSGGKLGEVARAVRVR